MQVPGKFVDDTYKFKIILAQLIDYCFLFLFIYFLFFLFFLDEQANLSEGLKDVKKRNAAIVECKSYNTAKFNT